MPTLLDLVNADHIRLGLEAADAQDAIQKLAGLLMASGHVAEGFAEDVWTREKTFPTGLPTRPLAVAIPHADPDHVVRSAVAIGTLKAPVQFAQMGTDGSTVLDVHLVFLLSIKEVEKQVDLIRQLMLLIQSPSLVEGLARAADIQAALRLIRGSLDS